MRLAYAFRVMEIGDFPPEEFGTEVLDQAPSPGDVITLHWLDGRVYRRAKVLRVDVERLHLDVETLPDED